MTEIRRKRWSTLIAFLTLCGGAILLGQEYPPGAWYDALRKPAITPPSWAFGAVWTPLYVMIAIAGWLLWESNRHSIAMKLWFAQLALNVAWSWIFFGLHRPDAALGEIIVLWIAIGATIVAAWPTQKTAALLLVPYWGWVAFATVLNFGFWQLNA
jgi:translocator protein